LKLFLLFGLEAILLALSSWKLPLPSDPPVLSAPAPYSEGVSVPLSCDCSITQDGNTYAISALLGNQSAAAFYSYGNPVASSANTGLEIADALIIFLYQDINTNITSLFLIADIGNSGSGGNMEFEANCLPSTAYVSVQDDAGEFFGVPPLITGSWSWLPCCTDGGVIEDIGCNNTLNLDLLVSNGISNIIWLTGDIANPTQIPLSLTGEAITINCGGGVCCPVDLDTAADIENASCSDTPNGSITVHPQDGYPPYSYNWSNGETDETIEDLLPGIYSVTITDSQGCTEEIQLSVDVSPGDPNALGATLEICSESAEALFDLTQLNETVNLGTGLNVLWFEQADMTGQIIDPSQYMTTTTTVYAAVDNGFCLSDPVAVLLTVLPSPIGMSASLNMCEEANGEANFDLTSLEDIISGGTGTVSWYYDAGTTNEVPDPSAFVTASTTVFALIDDGFCLSSPIEVMLIVDLLPLGNPASMELCGDQNNEAVFDLSLLELQISGGIGVIFWYSDAELLDVISSPTNFISTTTTVYAVINDGICDSEPIPVELIVHPTPIANAIIIEGCEDASGMAVFNLWDFASQVSGGTGAIDWFLDEFLTDPIQDPAFFETESTVIFATADNGICVSDAALITIVVSPGITGFPVELETCPDSTGLGTFNLMAIETEVSGGVGTVLWYEDNQGLIQISTPAAFTTTGTIVYAQITFGNCLSDFVPIQLSVVNSITAMPFHLDACDLGNGTGLFNLTSIETNISGGSGVVHWYIDSAGTIPLSNPDSLVSTTGSVYANVVAGNCISAIVEITLSVLPVPVAIGNNFTICGDSNEIALIDLTALDSFISQQTGAVIWYGDALFTQPVMIPDSFPTSDTILYAIVTNGFCSSDPVPVTFEIGQAMIAMPLDLNYCLPAGDTLEIDLTLLSSMVSGGGAQINWYTDQGAIQPILFPQGFQTDTSVLLYALATNGICYSPLVAVQILLNVIPDATPYIIRKCGDTNGLVDVDLTSAEMAVSQNSGSVIWYADETGSTLLTQPASVITGDSIFYAQVDNGNCLSPIVTVEVEVVDSLVANQIIIEQCILDTDADTIDLNAYELFISNGGGPVFWFSDSLQTDTLFNHDQFVTSGDTLFALIAADGCISNLVAVPIIVEAVMSPTPVCGFVSIDSVFFSWDPVAVDYQLHYEVNGISQGNPINSNSTTFGVGMLGQGDTVTLAVTAVYDGICNMSLISTATCITDVCPVQVLTLAGLDDQYCRDGDTIAIDPFPIGGQLSGVGISGYTFIPSNVNGLQTAVSYSWTDMSSGCTYDTTVTVDIMDPLPAPEINCNGSFLDSVSFSWSGQSGVFGLQYQHNLNAPILIPSTNTTSLNLGNLAEGDSILLMVWQVDHGICGNSDTVFTTCHTRSCPSAAVQISHVDLVCSNRQPFYLDVNTDSLTGIQQITWFGSGVVDPLGLFDPATAILGDNLISVTILADGCNYISSAVVEVVATPELQVEADDQVCLDSTATLTIVSEVSSSAVYHWNFGDAVVVGGSMPLQPVVQWNSPGLHVISLYVDDAGCISDTVDVQVQIDEPLALPELVCLDEQYYAIVVGWNPVPGATGYSAHSSDGSGVISGTTYSLFNLPDNTEVQIQLVASGSSVCGPSTASVICSTLDYIAPQVYVPNVFSPNGDGINDLFFIQTNQKVVTVKYLVIYDRWGNVVFKDTEFSPNDPTHAWDGTYRNVMLNPAVFTYIAEVEDVDLKAELISGSVTLVR
jgi:gliding motility-associated-like protein